MSIESQLADLAAATTNLLNEVTTKKSVLDDAVTEVIARAQQAIDKAAEASASATLAQTIRDAIVAVFGGLGYLPPVPYAAGIDLTTAVETVGYMGDSYAPKLDVLPYTTPGVFDPTKFRLIQGVSGADLGAPEGSGLVGLPQGGKVRDALRFLTPEMFGVPGAGSNDNALFVAAAAIAASSGLPIYALGAEYRLAGLVVTTSARIYFGKQTVVRNVQTSGTKLKSIQFRGGGLQGVAATVTGVGAADAVSTYHSDTVYVDDPGGFLVGQTVLLSENLPPQVCTRAANAGETQDFNYREFATVVAVTGNAIQFTEFLRFPYSTARSLKLQRVEFLEGAFVTGGIFIGRNAAGGGVGFEFCRYSGAVDIQGRGLSDADLDRNGGEVLRFERCWECQSERIMSKWTLFAHTSVQCQSCWFRNIGGKRTSNGGVISSGDTFCHIGPIVEDSPGRSNGDGLGISNGARRNTYGPFTISGARCYTLWLHQSCDDNVFLPIASYAGITGCVYCFGDSNHFSLVRAKGHPSFGVSFNGDYNYAFVDFEGVGTGVRIEGGTTGCRVVGRAVSLGTDSLSRDLLMGNTTNTVVDLIGGPRGMAYTTPTQAAGENHTNQINVRGPTPYSLQKADRRNGGYTWNGLLTGVSASNPVTLVGPGTAADPNGLAALTTTAVDAGPVYRISLRAMVGDTTSYSQYIAVTRQGLWLITPVLEAAGASAPRLTVSGANLRVSLNTTPSAQTVNVLLERF